MISEIQNIEAGKTKAIHHLVNSGHELRDVYPINSNRYYVIITNKGKFLFVYKREAFRNFGRIFRNQGQEGEGDSLNREDIVLALKIGITDLIRIFPDGNIYMIPILTILTKGIKWTNKEGKEVYSFSIHLFKKIDISQSRIGEII